MAKKRVTRKKAAARKAPKRAARPTTRSVYPITIKDLTDLMDEMEAWCCALREILLTMPPNFVVAAPKMKRGTILWDSGGQIRLIKGCPPPRLPQCPRPKGARKPRRKAA